MPLTYSEEDLRVVGLIQEKRNCTIDHAKSIYRSLVNKLANPDIEGRAEIVLEAFNRVAEVASDEEVEAAVDAPKKPKMTKNERRLAKKAEKAAKDAQKKAKAPKKASGKKERTRKPKEEPEPLVELSREVELTPIEDSNFYQVKFKGARATAYLLRRDQFAAARFGPLHIADTKFSELKKAAKKAEQEAVVCIERRVNGKVEQGYVLPVSSFQYLGDNNPYWRLEFSNADRKAHAEAGYDDARFSEKPAEAKAA
jgi:hypothetical protein